MQGPSRTPNSILRKRMDKENEGSVTMGMRRNKLTRRRVSFAPDDELETKHIFTENFHEEASLAARFGDAAAILALQQPGSVAIANALSAAATSPGNMSPLSMDLTNNSSEQSAQAEPHMPPAAIVAMNGGEAHQAPGPASFQPRPQQYAHRPRQVIGDYTRNITINVQPLSALVEEDEENFTGGGISSGAPLESLTTALTPGRHADDLAAHREPAGTPVSPSVLEEMLSKRDQLAVKWGNVQPGMQDTVDNLHWQAAVGDATYRHVYGGGPIGDITRALDNAPETAALKGDPGYRQLPGPLDPGARDRPVGNAVAYGHHRAQPAMQHPGGVRGATARAPAHFPDPTEGVDATLGILQGSPGLLGLHHADHESFPLNVRQAPALPPKAQLNNAPAAQMHMQSLIHSPLAKQLGLVPEPVTVPQQQQDNTTKMIRLDDTWEALCEQGRLSVASNRVMPPANRQVYAGVGAAACVGGDTVTLQGPQRAAADPNAAHTLQLLADTIPQKATFPHEMSMRQPPMPFAPPPRHDMQAKPLQSAAVSRCIADRQPQPVQDPTSSTSLDMHLGRSSMDLDLDAFGVPPEPTMDLGHQQQQGVAAAAAGGQRQGPGAMEAAGNRQKQQQNGQAGGMQVAAGAGASGAMGLGVPNRLAYQELLSMLHVTFHEGVCRMSYLPQAEPMPRTVKEVFEAVYETVPFIKVYQDIMIDMSQRLSKMQSRVQELETNLAVSAPRMLAELQETPDTQLEALRLQCGNLKRLCRLRTVHAIKQAHDATLGSLEQELDKFNEQLQLDIQFMTTEVRRLTNCCQELDALTNAMAKRRQADEKRLQEAALKQKVMDAQYQRLLAVRAQNAERRALRERRQAEEKSLAMETKITTDKLHEERSALLERVTALTARRNTTVMTPARANDMALKVERKRKELQALLNVTALGLDISNMDVTHRANLTFKGIYKLTLTLGDEDCTIGVRREASDDSFAVLAPTVAETLGTSASALGCTVSLDSLPMHLELILLRLHRMWRVEQQLEKCTMTYNCMIPPVIEQQAVPTLNLSFVNGDTATKVSLRMSWEAALSADAVEPELDVQLESMEAVEVRQETCQALHQNVLKKIAPSAGYLPSLCCAMSATLQVRPSS